MSSPFKSAESFINEALAIVDDPSVRINLSVSRYQVKKVIKKPEKKPIVYKYVKFWKRAYFKIKMIFRVFNVQKVMTESTNPQYKRLIKILANHYKSNGNAYQILEYIKGLSFFSKFIIDLGDVNEEALLQLCKQLRYEHFPPATCIFKEDDPSNDKFYIILKGSVCIVKKSDTNVFMEQNEKQVEKPVEKPIERVNVGKKRTFIKKTYSVRGDITGLKEKPPSLQKHLANLIAQNGVKIKDMREGEAFGEKALLAASKRTTAIITNTNCDMIVIMKNDYLSIIKKYDKRRQAKEDFMKNKIPYLGNISSTTIWEDLFYLIKEADYPKGSVIVNENEKGTKIFFVVSGYCELEKNILVESTNSHYDYEPVRMKKVIAKFGPGTCLGDEILSKTGRVYNYTIKVGSTMANIFYVERQSFLLRFPPESIQAIGENAVMKEKIHQEKIQRIIEEARKTFFTPNNDRINFKTNQIFKYFNSSSLNNARKHLMLNKSKDMDNQEKNFPSLHKDIITEEELQTQQQESYDQLIKNNKKKLNCYFRSTIQLKAKPSHSQANRGYNPSVRALKNRALSQQDHTLNTSRSNSREPETYLEQRSISNAKEEIISFTKNFEGAFKGNQSFRKMEEVNLSARTGTLQNEEESPSSAYLIEKPKLKLTKFDFGKNISVKKIAKATDINYVVVPREAYNEIGSIKLLKRLNSIETPIKLPSNTNKEVNIHVEQKIKMERGGKRYALKLEQRGKHDSLDRFPEFENNIDKTSPGLNKKDIINIRHLNLKNLETSPPNSPGKDPDTLYTINKNNLYIESPEKSEKLYVDTGVNVNKLLREYQKDTLESRCKETLMMHRKQLRDTIVKHDKTPLRNSQKEFSSLPPLDSSKYMQTKSWFLEKK